eukprot:1065238_1
MSALLVLVIVTETVIAQNTSVCVWGCDTTPTLINGEFIYQGMFNGGPWYKKVYGTDTRYLFKADTKYYISPLEPAINAAGNAFCASESTLYPYDCGDQWYVVELGQWQTDPDVFCETTPFDQIQEIQCLQHQTR